MSAMSIIVGKTSGMHHTRGNQKNESSYLGIVNLQVKGPHSKYEMETILESMDE